METTNLNRRAFISAVAVTSVAVTHLPRMTFAQEATPAHADHGSDLSSARPAPELEIEITDDGVVMPADVAAGLNRVTVTNSSSSHFSLVLSTLPPDVAIEEVNALLADLEAPAPEWLPQQWLPGSPSGVAVGESVSGYAFFHAGSYFAANIFAAVDATEFEVTGDPWGVPAPQSDLRVGMVEYAFLGVEEPVSAGPQTWEVVNHGASLHEVVLLTTPELWTAEQVLEMITAETEGPPEGVDFLPGTGFASPGSTVWLDLDLGVGAYALVCFASDDFTGPPHVFLGMISTFEVV